MSSTAQVPPAAAVTGGMDKIAGINQTALEGIQRGMRKLHEAAHEIATAPVERKEPTELAEPLIEMIEAQRAIEASAVVLRRANEAIDSVLEALGS
jgi:hypothetical protein